MQQKSKDIQNHFVGFLKTPCLWKEKNVYDLQQFEIEQKAHVFNAEIEPKLRLGKYIERFVSFQLSQDTSVEIISENIQIQKEKITLGELDCIILKDDKPIHLEIIYKFYLYDETFGESEIDHFIGPNRKDSLVDKLDKLKDKQLPLLYSTECLEYINSINLDANKIEQQVYFKAQLFVPYRSQNIKLNQLNSDSIVGFYINRNEIHQFEDCKFYIPNKKDWLVVPHQNINWLNFSQFLEESKPILERQFSPMCWVKNKNGILEKFFLVWW
jgi:hypothetical protein